MDLIEQFLARYQMEFDFYDQTARLGAQLIEQQLQNAGIRAIVTARAKSLSRLEEKIRQRSNENTYASVEEISKDIVDLAGVRVALYFPGERDQVGKVISQLFVTEGTAPKVFPTESKAVTREKRFSGYWATHYRVRLREGALNDTQKRYALAQIEIQVASVLMHAWAEVEHDLVYKPLQGALSDAEYAILDQINGMVIAGEIALEQLQNAGKQRVAAQGRLFLSHFDLADYLLDQAGPVLKSDDPDTLLGRINVLYRFLVLLNQATPDALKPYLDNVSTDFERRPLADQIIDQLLAEEPDRYDAYEKARVQEFGTRLTSRSDDQGHETDQERAIGQFLKRWINLERQIRELAIPNKTRPWLVPTSKVVGEALHYDERRMAEFDRIRRFRNNLVHGVEVPSTSEINAATRVLESMIRDTDDQLSLRTRHS